MDQSIEQYIQRLKRMIHYTIYLLTFAGLGIGFSTYPPFFSGLALGLSVGFISLIYTAIQTHKIGQAAERGEKPPHLGMGMRFALAALGGIIVYYFPEHFNLIGLGIGLLLPIIIMVTDAIVFQIKRKDRAGKG